MSEDEIRSRLKRIEDSLSEVRELIVKMARVEERIMQDRETHRRMWERIERLEESVNRLGVRMAQSAWIERGAWVVIAAAIAYFAKVTA